MGFRPPWLFRLSSRGDQIGDLAFRLGDRVLRFQLLADDRGNHLREDVLDRRFIDLRPGSGGQRLLGEDAEGATDGSHPSDLGFVRQADAFEPVLRQALQQ